MTDTADIIVIGAGMAGASLAAELAAHAGVIVLEQESHPGHHSTGRSAAFFAAAYGNEVVRGITAASEPFYRDPPAGFSELTLLRPRDCLYVARQDQQQQLLAMQADNALLQAVPAALACARVPALSAGYVAAALLEPGGGDLDVDAILQGYLRLLRQRGGVLQCERAVQALRWSRGRWLVTTSSGSFAAPIVVNAAGAWAEHVAGLAGVQGLGLVPRRRTAILIDPPAGVDCSDWPMVVGADEEFYFKPEAGQLLVSPADETASEPCDAQPEELDVAIVVDRFEQVTGLAVKRVNHRWAGLRTFAPDHTFVVGFDPHAQGFFWLAGQGGYGIQSAPGLAQLGASLLTGTQPAQGFAGVLAYAGEVAPARLLV